MNDVPELDFRHVVELFPDAVVAARGEVIVYVNAAAEQLLGWSRESLIGEPLVTIIPERLREAHRVGIARYRQTRVPRLIGKPVRVPALTRAGAEVDVELTISAFENDMFLASLRDLRDRVELERTLAIADQLRTATHAAAALVSRLDFDHVATTAVRTLTGGLNAVLARVWIADEDERTLRLRASAGLSERTTESSRATIDVATYPYKVGQVARSREAFIKNDLSDPGEFEQDWVTRERLRAVAAFPLLAGERLGGVLAAFFREPLQHEQMDLLQTFATMVSAAANDVRLFGQLEAAVDARDHFLSMASHELNTPITTLKLQLDGIARVPLDEVLETRVRRAQKQVGRLAALVRELLDVSRIAEGRFPLTRERVNLASIVAEVVDRHTVDIETAQCPLSLELGDAYGLWDRERIDQVVTNLLGNALKYGIGKPIVVRVESLDRAARLTVRDQGMGIAPEDQPRIFQRFERATRGGTQAGLGLGLWIACQIVRAHEGSIRVMSDVGKGATFVVELPTPELSRTSDPQADE